jgi:hypothetical protein
VGKSRFKDAQKGNRSIDDQEIVLSILALKSPTKFDPIHNHILDYEKLLSEQLHEMTHPGADGALLPCCRLQELLPSSSSSQI